jgi:chemotaxis family two-component system response regulator Rcp1
MGEKVRRTKLLLVEDNFADAELTREAFKEVSAEVNVDVELYVVKDGEEALVFLKKIEDNPKTLPDLILLDINLPKVNGFEVLKFIKTDPFLMIIPVIILTSSQNEEDVKKSYHLYANAYIVKPVDFEEFIRTMKGICEFWFNISYHLKPKVAQAR